MNQSNGANKIIIIEFGGQYTHLISRRIRDLGAYVKLIAHDSIELEDWEVELMEKLESDDIDIDSLRMEFYEFE